MPIDVNCSAWKGFRTGEWRHLVNVRNFIQKNYTPYAGDESFLAPTSERTQKVWDKSHALILEELRKGILDVETEDRKSTRLNSSHSGESRMPSSA